MTDLRKLDELLRATDGDAGCAAGARILDAYVELELAGEDPAGVYPRTALHLERCSGWGGQEGPGRGFPPARRFIWSVARVAGLTTTGCSRGRAGSAT